MVATLKCRVKSDDGEPDHDTAPPHAFFLVLEMRREKYHFWACCGSTDTSSSEVVNSAHRNAISHHSTRQAPTLGLSFPPTNRSAVIKPTPANCARKWCFRAVADGRVSDFFRDRDFVPGMKTSFWTTKKRKRKHPVTFFTGMTCSVMQKRNGYS
jgi:hypothetical protein